MPEAGSARWYRLIDKDTLGVIFSRRMLVALLMGFSCGVPLLITISVLQAWMRKEGVDLEVIGLYALVGMPYTLKFIWAPLLDRYVLPFMGRRRGWLLIFQICLMLSIVWLGFGDPKNNPWLVALAAFFVTFFSASQDIEVDAYRREDLADEELGLGSTLYVQGYRLGMLLASGGGLALSDHIPFSYVYFILAATMLVGIATTIFTPEPVVTEGRPGSFKEAVIGPFVEFFTRSDVLTGLLILAFVLLYKIGDSMASFISTPFYLDLGFSGTEIAVVTKGIGFWFTIGGTALGGIILLKLGINKCLWIFGFLQAVSTAGFAVLAWIGYSNFMLAVVIAFENLSGGMGTSVFVAFMAAITNKRFTATQFALLSSLMAVPRVVASATTGFIAESLGWQGFFIFCTLAAIPGMALLLVFAPLKGKNKWIPSA